MLKRFGWATTIRPPKFIMKISFCITCKNRLFHLKQTLPTSLLASSDYLEKEFIILDYNSEDGLYNWAKKHLSHLEKSGTIRYLRTRLPKYYNSAHAKNIAHKNATGDILFNLDADNFVTKGYCQYLNKVFEEPNVILSSSSEDMFGNVGCCGRIAATKDTFYSVNGYDEQESLNSGWGWDDVNFRLRAVSQNGLKVVQSDIKYNLVLHHSNEIRVQDFSNKNIQETKKISRNCCLEILNKRKDYIANINKKWGFVQDLEIGLGS